MSGRAEILLERGFTVSGSDAHESSSPTNHSPRSKDRLRTAGGNITTISTLLYIQRQFTDNPEYAAAAEKNLPILSRAELLGQLMKNYEKSIAVSGTPERQRRPPC